eukprot:UN16290
MWALFYCRSNRKFYYISNHVTRKNSTNNTIILAISEQIINHQFFFKLKYCNYNCNNNVKYNYSNFKQNFGSSHFLGCDKCLL